VIVLGKRVSAHKFYGELATGAAVDAALYAVKPDPESASSAFGEMPRIVCRPGVEASRLVVVDDTGAAVESALYAVKPDPESASSAFGGMPRIVCRPGVEVSRLAVFDEEPWKRRVRRALLAAVIALLVGIGWYLVRARGELFEVKDEASAGCRVCVNRARAWRQCSSLEGPKPEHLQQEGPANIVDGCFDQMHSWRAYRLRYECGDQEAEVTGKCDTPKIVIRPRSQAPVPPAAEGR
jgi:hypothetical protein